MAPSKVNANIATKQHSAPSGTPSTRRIVLLVFLAVGLLQSAVLVGVAVVGHRAFVRLDAKLQQLEPYSTVFTEAHAPQEVVEKVGDVLRAVVGDFVLGASNGQIANFVSNLLQKDLGGISKDVYLWAQQVEQGMLNTSCSRWIAECPPLPTNNNYYWGQPYANITCGARGPMETCFNYPDDYYWYPANYDLPCDTTWCAGENFRDVSRYTEAVADKLMEIPTLSAPSGPAAFSNGLFQVDGLFQWIDTQTGLGGWKAAGLSCLSLVAKARPIAWDGCFTDTVDQSTQCWNVTSSVRQVLDYATQICQGLSNVPWQ